MTNFASQHNRYKSTFIQACSALTSAKKNTVLKVVVDRLMQ